MTYHKDNNGAVISFLAFLFAMALGAAILWFLSYRGFIVLNTYKESGVELKDSKGKKFEFKIRKDD